MRVATTAILALLFFCLTLLTGCNGVKNLTPPSVDLPQNIGMEESHDTLTIADLRWWEFYGDEYLREIISKTLENNKRLAIAAARVEKARQQLGFDKANLLPTLGGNIYANRETNHYNEELVLLDPEIGIKASVRWEADLWGNLRWTKKKSAAEMKSMMDNERAMRMTLVAEAASAYFRLVALDNELWIVRHTIEMRKEAMELARIRFQGGLTAEIPYQQAKVEYATAAALVPNLEANINATENALAILMGENPETEIKRSSELTNNTLEGRIPVGIPSELLERRPDVQASEASLKAAMAAVGAAYADRFPKLNIELTGGVEDNDFGNLLKSPFSFVMGGLTGPIFDFGRKKSKYKAAIAAYEEARLGYEQKVLEVFKEADDAVIGYRSACNAVALKTNQLEAANKYNDLTRKQYVGGSINYIDVLDSQRRYLEAQIGLNNAIRDEHLALVQLYKVLGGGWQL
ncbi:MAG: TolC family protein [Paramuribaculum sp.]|nr:TolC family protein [Paramuribaculum sp.]